MRSSHDLHEMNISRTSHVCLSVRMIQLENRRQDLEKILYGRYAVAIYPKIILFNLTKSVVPKCLTRKLENGNDTSANCKTAT
jgi:hypothetical protein